MQVIVFSSRLTPRLQYTANFISNTICGCDALVTDDPHQYKAATGIKISYTATRSTEQDTWIQPHALLFEQGIQQQDIKCFQWENTKAFFATAGDIPFDMLAATFFLLSRYEEYLPHPTDTYGRFAHTASLAFRESFLHQPLINIWLETLKGNIIKQSPRAEVSTQQFEYMPTYDIDIAFAYHNRGLFATTGGLLKDLRRPRHLKQRLQVIAGKAPDPFDVYAWLDTLHVQHRLHPLYFFLLAEKRGIYDKNVNPQAQRMQQLVQQHAKNYTTGIHPSWQSGDEKDLLLKEITILRDITRQQVTHSRQHYIRMQLPDTYRRLIKTGITHDHSMGYGSINGFRASVCTPFPWYDLEKEEQTGLTLHPFCFMDANSFFEQQYNAAQAAEELQQYHNTVKQVNGTLITIFHNHFLTQEKQWMPWREMYSRFLRQNF